MRFVGEKGGVWRERMATELHGAEHGEGGSRPRPLAHLLGRCGGARRRACGAASDVTVAAAVVGAGSAAAKCELRPARAGGGVKSGSGGGEGQDGGGGSGQSCWLLPIPVRPGSRRRLQPSFLAPLCSVFAPVRLSPDLLLPAQEPGAAGFPLRVCLCCGRLHPVAGRASVL